MPSLDTELARFLRHPGVEHVVLLGMDGLVVHHAGAPGGLDEAIAASVPALVTAAGRVGDAAGRGGAATVAVELERGVLIAVAVHSDLSLAVLLRPGHGFAPLLRELRSAAHGLGQLL